MLVLGQEKKKGKQCKDGGKKPSWNDSFEFIAKDNILNIEIWDKDTITPDDIMGKGVFDLKKVYASPNTPITGINQYT